jgi:hypothetical protein
VVADPAAAALLALLLLSAVLADRAAAALLALALASAVLAERAAAALPAPVLQSAVLAERASAALLAPALQSAVLADPAATALLALALDAVVRAEDVYMAVPVHCTAALRTAAATAIAVVGASASASAAAGGTGATVQPADQILLLSARDSLLARKIAGTASQSFGERTLGQVAHKRARDLRLQIDTPLQDSCIRDKRQATSWCWW